MPTPTVKTRVTAAEWRKRYAEICAGEVTLAPRRRLDQPKFLIAELEYTLENPPPGRWRTIKAPSDPKRAFEALYGYLSESET